VLSAARIRSMLFVPGHKLDWILKAPKYGPDALLCDLEDAVPVAEKAAARETVAEGIGQLQHRRIGLFVRVNGWRTGEMLSDVASVVVPGLDGIMIPKLRQPEEVTALDLVLTEMEMTRGLDVGSIEIMPGPETAFGMLHSYQALTASPRVRRGGGVLGATPNGDYYRALGSRYRDDGLETLFSSSKNVMEARAAGLQNILCGTISDLDDLVEARRIMSRCRDLGANGALVIHPSHVTLANEVFSPTEEDISAARDLVVAFAAAVDIGSAAVRHAGHMVDYAHLRSCYDLLTDAKALGLTVGDYPDLNVPAYD
jgi:citrate lyase subunit beta / citryl-CoA lyase